MKSKLQKALDEKVCELYLSIKGKKICEEGFSCSYLFKDYDKGYCTRKCDGKGFYEQTKEALESE